MMFLSSPHLNVLGSACDPRVVVEIGLWLCVIHASVMLLWSCSIDIYNMCWHVPLSENKGGGPIWRKCHDGQGSVIRGGSPSLKFEPGIWRESLSKDKERGSGFLGLILIDECALSRQDKRWDSRILTGCPRWHEVFGAGKQLAQLCRQVCVNAHLGCALFAICFTVWNSVRRAPAYSSHIKRNTEKAMVSRLGQELSSMYH